MKVVHVSTVHPALDTRIFVKECKSLASTGAKVVLIARFDNDVEIDGVQILGLPSYRLRIVRMTLGVIQAGWMALRQRGDLYHFHDPELLWLLAFMKFMGCRVVFDMHENVRKDISSKTYIPLAVRSPIISIVLAIEKFCLSKTPVVFAELSYSKDYPDVRFSEVVLNLPLLHKLNSAPRNPDGPCKIGYCGAVSVSRGIIDTIQALAILKQRGIEVEFECVGQFDEGLEQEVQHLLARHNIQGFKIFGRLPPTEAWRMIGNWDAGLAVLHDEPNLRESYPTKMFEYMGSGVAVITSDFPLYRSVIERFDCGACIRPGDSEALASAIEWVVRNRRESHARGAKGLDAVRFNYSWESEFQKLRAFYSRVMCS